jgi:hypothetical protein
MKGDGHTEYIPQTTYLSLLDGIFFIGQPNKRRMEETSSSELADSPF